MTIYEFNGENLAQALKNDYTTPGVIQAKNHFQYFMRYLGDEGLQARTMVIEKGYVSKDYLHDFAAYYALCFTPFPKICDRIHFFKTSVTEELLQRALLEEEEVAKDFWENYLGFIVVKPIPTTVIGFSVLKHYNSSIPVEDRHFWGLRKYKVHFFGKEIEVESLAFQEQDSVLAACATTAIWSMLNKAAIDFHTILKSPSDITRDADNVSPDGSRLFPNKGLSVLQICQAIFNSGLVSEVKSDNFPEFDDEGELIDLNVSNSFTRKILNAYSPLGIPIILVIQVPDGQEHGLHAITVSGFRQAPPVPVDPSDEARWLSDNIDRIYAHDDQWGPFVRIDFQNEMDLKTPWTERSAEKRPTRVKNVIVPVFPKVRISYEDIESIVRGFDAWLTLFFKDKLKNDLVWDIKIDYSEKFKSHIRTSNLSKEEKLKHLTASLPKYIWIATCYTGSHKLFQITFDATNVNNGMIGLEVISYSLELKGLFHGFLVTNETIVKSVATKRHRLHYYDFLKDKLA